MAKSTLLTFESIFDSRFDKWGLHGMDEVFADLDKDGGGEISVHEMMDFCAESASYQAAERQQSLLSSCCAENCTHNVDMLDAVVQGKKVHGMFTGLWKGIPFLAGVAYLVGGSIFFGSATKGPKGLIEAEVISNWQWATYFGSFLYTIGSVAFFHMVQFCTCIHCRLAEEHLSEKYPVHHG
jgi:hypothetical protein